MNKRLIPLCAITIVLIAPFGKVNAQDPITLIIKEGIKKVIRAVDLKIQRLQTKTIWLQNAQRELENTMSKLRLDEITVWVQKQKDLYQQYFDELWKVKDAVAYYHRIREITQKQIALVREYKRGYNGVKGDGHFSVEEVLYIGQVYTGIIEESIRNLDQVALVINSFTTQMSDAQRMKVIDQASNALDENYRDLEIFNTQNISLSLQRAKDEKEIAKVKWLYQIS